VGVDAGAIEVSRDIGSGNAGIVGLECSVLLSGAEFDCGGDQGFESLGVSDGLSSGSDSV
jgi:hypothetical protein